MTKSLNITLTDDLYEFVQANSGDGTAFVTPDEFICEMLRQQKIQIETNAARNSIREGYEDAIAGHLIEYRGDVREMLRRATT